MHGLMWYIDGLFKYQAMPGISAPVIEIKSQLGRRMASVRRRSRDLGHVRGYLSNSETAIFLRGDRKLEG